MIEAFRSGTSAEVWQSLVQEAYGQTGRRLDESSESHLVFLLLRYQGDALLLSRTQGMDWLEAQMHAGRARVEALRDVGDRCLLLAGLFPGVAERRLVTVDYFVALGHSAYQGVADAARHASASLYAHLARGYRELVRTLAAIRTLPDAHVRLGTLH